MSDCGVCLHANVDDAEGTIDSTEMVVLDREVKCSECNRAIQDGVTLEQANWYHDGWNYDEDREEEDTRTPIYTCVVCAEIATAFFCNGRWYGGALWEEFSESGAFDALNTSCFDRLTTPEAKAYLRERWMQWKGL